MDERWSLDAPHEPPVEARQERPATIEMPQLLVHVSTLVELTMHLATHPSPSNEIHLISVQRAMRILCDVVSTIESRDISAGLRHLERGIALNRQRREPWE